MSYCTIKNNDKIIVEKCEMAFDFTTRFFGLMMRKKEDFPNGSGLLFNKCSSIHMFFMRFPIDVVYMDKYFKVTKIERNLKINRLSNGTKDTFYTLELPIGGANDINENDYLNIDFK